MTIQPCFIYIYGFYIRRIRKVDKMGRLHLYKVHDSFQHSTLYMKQTHTAI